MDPFTAMAVANLAQGVFGAFGASAEAARKKAEFDRQEYIRQTQFNKKAYNEMMANVNRNIMNNRINKVAGTQYGTNKAIINILQDRQEEDVMRSYQAMQSKMDSQLTGRGIDPSSGTGQALSRMNLNNAFKNIKTLEWNRAQSLRKNKEEMEQSLSRMNLSEKAPDAYIPGVYSGATPTQALGSGLLGAGLSAGGSIAGGAFESQLQGLQIPDLYGSIFGGN
tara:strand:- start:711 stop:1379 length:669 start_codon:yes stop_codon:yes gene_type:complete